MTKFASASPADLTPPSHLSARAVELWHFVVPARANSLPQIALVRSALEALDRADAAREQIAKEGLTFTTISTGAIHLNPLTRLEKESRAAFVATWAGVLKFDWIGN